MAVGTPVVLTRNLDIARDFEDAGGNVCDGDAASIAESLKSILMRQNWEEQVGWRLHFLRGSIGDSRPTA